MGINSQAQNSFGPHDLDILGATRGGVSRKNVGEEEENKILVGRPQNYRGHRGTCLFLDWVGDCLLSLTTRIPASEQNLLCFSGRIRAISCDASSRRRWRATSSGLVAFGSDWIGQMTCLVRVITGP